MTLPDGKTLRQKMIQTLTDNPQHIAIVQLFQLQAQSTIEDKTQIRQTILLVLENHHEWTKISKCLKLWKELDKYIRSFYKRMKQRVNEECDMNLSIADMQSDFQRMFDKHKLTVKNKAEPLNADIQRFLTQDYKKTTVSTNSNLNDMKKQDSKKDQPIIKRNFPNKIIQQPIQKLDTSQKSNSLSSRDSNFSNVRAIQKKPTFGMLRRQESSSNSSSNLVTRRNTSRRTFGQGTQLKSIQVNKIDNTTTQLKQDSKNTKTQATKQQQSKPKQLFKSYNQSQIQKKEEIKNKPDQPKKLNIFQRKQQTIINRPPNPLFTTQRKQITQNINLLQPQVKSKQKRLDSSLSKSVTPQKPLVHRKKIILKKPSDFEKNFFDSDDQFSSFKKLQSYEKSQEIHFYSQEKESFPLMNTQEEQLRMEIQNQFSRQPVIIDQPKNPQVEVNIDEKSKENIFNQQKGHHQQQHQKVIQSKPMQSKPKPPAFKQSSIQISMVRHPDQLFSDYQVSLMGFNPRGLQSGVDYFKLADKCKAFTWKTESNKWDLKIEKLKDRNKKV